MLGALQELGVGHSIKHEVCGSRKILLAWESISSTLSRTQYEQNRLLNPTVLKFRKAKRRLSKDEVSRPVRHNTIEVMSCAQKPSVTHFRIFEAGLMIFSSTAKSRP